MQNLRSIFVAIASIGIAAPLIAETLDVNSPQATVVATIRAQAAICSGWWAVTAATPGDHRLVPDDEAEDLIEQTGVLYPDGERPIELDQFWQLGRLSFDIFESAPSHPHADVGGPTYIETMNDACRQLAQSAEGIRQAIEKLEAKP